MKGTYYENIFRKMGALTLSTILMVGIMVSSAFAIDDGTYTVKTVTSYVNPDTGKLMTEVQVILN